MCSLCVVDALIDNLSLRVCLICSRESGSNVCDFVTNSLLLLQALRSEHTLSTSVVNAMSVTDSEPNFRARAAALGRLCSSKKIKPSLRA